MGNGDRRNSGKMRRRKSQAKLKGRLRKAATARAERIATAGKAAEKKPTRAARKPAAAGSGAPCKKAKRLISLLRRLLPHLGQAGVCDGATRLLRKLYTLRQRGQANS